jgi:hypothetical protein
MCTTMCVECTPVNIPAHNFVREQHSTHFRVLVLALVGDRLQTVCVHFQSFPNAQHSISSSPPFTRAVGTPRRGGNRPHMYSKTICSTARINTGGEQFITYQTHVARYSCSCAFNIQMHIKGDKVSSSSSTDQRCTLMYTRLICV